MADLHYQECIYLYLPISTSPFNRTLYGTVDIGSIEADVICYSGDSIAEIKEIETGCIKNIQVKYLYANKHLVLNSLTNEFIPFKMNIITKLHSRFRVIRKDSIAPNVPSVDFYVTGGHKILLNGEYIKINNLDVLTWGYNEWISYSEQKKISWTTGN